ncbi:hypothetical protein D623_10010161 [Myotis brandtii]|uniref:Uncharacterized protein n=1 Tax=Myotis brandtii TaxID=109478 RepID=S7Q2T3_MYOBR|nr:hypothetical protein D623_10010161 [Myotis brandtii]
MASPATQPPPWTCPRLERLTSLLSSGALSRHLGLLLGGEEQEALQEARGCRKVEKASGKGVSETAALGAGALEQTREVGRGPWCCLLTRQANLGYTSDCVRASPQGQRPARPWL